VNSYDSNESYVSEGNGSNEVFLSDDNNMIGIVDDIIEETDNGETDVDTNAGIINEQQLIIIRRM
jgi:hypothetical protein